MGINMIRLHYIQHVPFEGLGYIEKYANENKFEITGTRIYAGEPFPHADNFDWLVVMGGPMSVYEEKKYLWIADEKRFIESAIKKGKKVLGICLGAQMIASVLGARVFPNKYKEIGWFPVELTEEASKTSFFRNVPQNFIAFHWHGDTFDIPKGALHCVSSRACVNQAFVYEKNVAALQFHCESTTESINALIDNCSDELGDGLFIQESDTIRGFISSVASVNTVMECLLGDLKISGL
jgi:GMP synthase-like glutamine amidotransferase